MKRICATVLLAALIVPALAMGDDQNMPMNARRAQNSEDKAKAPVAEPKSAAEAAKAKAKEKSAASDKSKQEATGKTADNSGLQAYSSMMAGQASLTSGEAKQLADMAASGDAGLSKLRDKHVREIKALLARQATSQAKSSESGAQPSGTASDKAASASNHGNMKEDSDDGSSNVNAAHAERKARMEAERNSAKNRKR